LRLRAATSAKAGHAANVIDAKGKEMVTRYDILKGDSTTADGTVIGGDSLDTVGGREQAYELDPVWCPACQSTGRIVCVGSRISCKGPDGREAALSGDLCVCQCEPSPFLISSQRTSWMDI
jgi:uncharacterized Zn-binding protein involved in type VI secretion